MFTASDLHLSSLETYHPIPTVQNVSNLSAGTQEGASFPQAARLLFPFPRSDWLISVTQYMDRRVYVHIQANRAMSGVLRGYDMFLNLVLEQSFEELGAGERKPCGTSVSVLLVTVYSHLVREERCSHERTVVTTISGAFMHGSLVTT